MASRNDDFLLVAAIDFGTAYSGYAFSSRTDFKRDPLNVSANTWTGATLMSLKTSTCVLFDKKKQFKEFGFAAEDEYGNLAEEGDEHRNYYFFRRFKMMLYNKMTLKRRFMLEDELGKKMPAMDVFSACIRYLREHLMKRVQQQLPDVKDDEIRWVLTVPAIWNDVSKQFMREAAEQAGMVGDSLIMALEPEAASLCCRYLPMNTLKGSSRFMPFRPETRYLVFDAGGGTVDITVHEVKASGSLKELYKANGGNWGGTYIDKAFHELLADIVGNDVMADFSENKMMDNIDLFREFEVKKRSFSNQMSEKITIKVPIALNEMFKEKTGKNIKDHVNSLPRYKDKLQWVGDKIRMEASIAKGLFNDACQSAAEHLKSLFSLPEVKSVDTVLMVGGFSESPILQDLIRKAVESLPDKKKLIVPKDPGLAVLKGAVIYGHDPSVIEERKCRYTYGVGTSFPFKKGVHPEQKKVVNSNGEEFCGGMFDAHVKIGQEVVRGESQATRSYRPIKDTQTEIEFQFFATTDPEPTFTSDPNCTDIGKLTIDVPGSGLDRSVSIKMIFGDTEMHVEAVAKDEKSNKSSKVKAALHFLG
ncbi:heat shock 70 kDa protein 12A-like [Mya arenaria]|uniref:heat shock 70 kDa protein 12A-like n=1 Tax=Mya arenaria TaxID=6604 RepID=UPI0022E94039|nr:heat shock 70 kDa protein 12A-like [Mya arenaria]